MTPGKLNLSGFRFQKRYGQNFITDTNLLSAIVSDARVGAEDFVVEVGAGAGSLTAALCERAAFVTAFEIDRNLAPFLDELKTQKSNLNIIYGDVLKQDLSAVLAKPFHLVANLPYYITTPVMFHFLENPDLKSLTVMVQKEVAERFTAAADTPSYGAVTAQLKAYGTPKICRTVSRKLFTPEPNVDSAVVHMEICKKQGVHDFAVLKKLIACAFAMRRKTLANNLCAGFSLSKDAAGGLLKKAGFSESVRGETLSIDDFIVLANFLADE